MLIVGLTGNIASGKSTVARLLAAHGATVVDADVLAREAVEPGSAALQRIVARWGSAIRRDDGTLDRAALRRIVFDTPAELAALNAIVHPEVARRRDALLADARSRGDRMVVAVIPLLFEVGLADQVDTIVLVDAPPDLRLARLMADRGLDEAQARAMIRAQMPAEIKRQRATHVVENEGDLEALASRVDELWEMLAADPRAAAPPA